MQAHNVICSHSFNFSKRQSRHRTNRDIKYGSRSDVELNMMMQQCKDQISYCEVGYGLLSIGGGDRGTEHISAANLVVLALLALHLLSENRKWNRR